MKGEVFYVDGKRCATPEYRSWQMMKNRCLNPNAEDYRYYGGRGISLCERWMTYDNFIADMGRKPTLLHTLDRKDVNKNYNKKNCRWATRAIQAQNRNYNRFTMTTARRIRKLYASGHYYQYEIAAMFETSQAMVSQITRGDAWKEVAQ